MSRTRVAVLGGGLVGGFMAEQLAADPLFEVTLFDRDRSTLDRLARSEGLRAQGADLADRSAVSEAVRDVDLVVCALPGHLGHDALAAVLAAGRSCVDISFSPEDPRSLASLAEARGLTAIVDCGVMPGLGGMLAVHFASKVKRAERASILVGGLPVLRRRPLEYRASFSPVDVIEEYTRPVRLVEYGQRVTKPALSEVELVDLPGVGTLEAFNTDGLRTLLDSLPIPHLREKTLRYPGHAERICMFRDLGFFSAEPIRVGPQEVRPLDLTTALLIREWTLAPGEEDLTVMRVEVEGVDEGGRRVLHRADLLDRTDPATGALSMARTTGFPAVIAARMMAQGRIGRRGIVPAELLGADEALLASMLDSLASVGIRPRFEVLTDADAAGRRRMQ